MKISSANRVVFVDANASAPPIQLTLPTEWSNPIRFPVVRDLVTATIEAAQNTGHRLPYSDRAMACEHLGKDIELPRFRFGAIFYHLP